MWITEYNEERAHAQSREEGYEEGREEGFDEGVSVGEARGINIGREQGLIEGIAGFVKSGVITLAQAAEPQTLENKNLKKSPNTIPFDVSVV